MSIQKIFKERSSGPYQQTLKVQVVAVGEPISYTTKGVTKKSLTSAVSDGETVGRMLCYDASKFAKIKVGTALIVRNFIRRMEDGIHQIIVTSTSKTAISSEIVVPLDHQAQGNKIINPPPAEQVTINDALASPLKKRFSIAGKITQEEEPREVQVKGEATNLKTITVEDSTAKTKVTLWRETSQMNVRPGDFVEITDLVVNNYNNQTSLSTTYKSKLKKIETPVQAKAVTVDALDVDVENETTEVYSDNGEIIVVKTSLLQEALGQDNIELAVASGPFKIKVQCRGSEVISVEKL